MFVVINGFNLCVVIKGQCVVINGLFESIYASCIYLWLLGPIDVATVQVLFAIISM